MIPNNEFDDFTKFADLLITVEEGDGCVSTHKISINKKTTFSVTKLLNTINQHFVSFLDVITKDRYIIALETIKFVKIIIKEEYKNASKDTAQ